MFNKDSIEIIGGGTISHVRNHLALIAPAYGKTAHAINNILLSMHFNSFYNINMHLTKMANQGKGKLETNEDVAILLNKLLDDHNTKIIFFNPALVDYNGSITTEGAVGYEWANDLPTQSGKYEERLQTSKGPQTMILQPTPKLVSKIRKERKDIFLVAFKTTCGATEDEQFLAGLNLLKTASCNLVLANDTKTRINMIITPEQARYSVTQNRELAILELVTMTMARSQLHFTRSTVVEGLPVPWSNSTVPETLRRVVDHCITKGAYKPFNGATVGHFAVKVDDKTFLTSRRKTDFNNLKKIGLVKVESNGTDSVIAYGSKPSVGGMSQRIIFSEHPESDCIVHFHCPPKFGIQVPTKEQKLLECGSHECGKNTSNGLKEIIPGIKCVYLDNHGPNIVFNRNVDPQRVIEFIDYHFDLSKSTDQVNRL